MEKKIIFGYKSTSEHGRSTMILECPFCKTNVTVYLWSFRGCGKKCSCGAKLKSNFTAEKI